MKMRETGGKAWSCCICGLLFTSRSNLLGCNRCSWFIHRACNLISPSLVGHPAHYRHQLHLLHEPDIYRSYICDICEKHIGEGSHYRCKECSFDAHVLCAYMPQTVRSCTHGHPLSLRFVVRVPTTICDVCNYSIHHCHYRCGLCNVDVHPGCLTKADPSTRPEKTSPERTRPDRRRGQIIKAWEVMKLVAKKASMHLLFDRFGLSDTMYALLFGRVEQENVSNIVRAPVGHTDVPDRNRGISLHKIDFYDLPPSFYNHLPHHLRSEFASLLMANMRCMVAGYSGSHRISDQNNDMDGEGVNHRMRILREHISNLMGSVQRNGIGVCRSVMYVQQDHHRQRLKRAYAAPVSKRGRKKMDFRVCFYEVPTIREIKAPNSKASNSFSQLAMATTIGHRAHGQYQLQLMNISDTNGMATRCSGCEQPFKPGEVYGCLECRFFLHRCCALLSQSQLPSLQFNSRLHEHVLQPLYASAYIPGGFQCNICRKSGRGFNYHCHSCSFDVHFLCALMPQTFSSQAHQHSLQLRFPPSVGSTNCDICRRQIDHCRYMCGNCNFNAHPGGLAIWVGRKVVMHLLFDMFGGLGEVVDNLLFASEDISFFTDLFSFFPESFLNLPALHDVDDRIRKELANLLRVHMKGMVGGDASSS
ncbi:hypothetical protein EJ110_NYTH23874 [Nymphaea thermarum]|nr:hypothetical protein EJ110_NYTH23874 [Nymphaea thermarum]